MDIISTEEALRIGAKLCALRQARGMSQSGLARLAGLTPQRLCAIEGGRAKGWAALVADLAKVADKLSVTVHTLLSGAIAPKPATRKRRNGHAAVPMFAPPSPVSAYEKEPTKDNLLAAISYLQGLVPKPPVWADSEARHGLSLLAGNPQLREDEGEPPWFVELQRRLAPHIEAEARAMLEEIP